jgi:regulator of replication initiation timing
LAMVDRMREESGEKPEDAARKLQHVKKVLARARLAITDEDFDGEPEAAAKHLAGLAREMKVWDDTLEEVRADLVELIAERDRWRIAHDKLRERIDHHSIAPRSEIERKPQSSKVVSPRPRAASDESQDFSAIDQELERLNASMLRELSSE